MISRNDVRKDFNSLQSFKDINEALNIVEVGRYLGLIVNGNRTKCPFHNDSTPSLVFYGDHYYCFGCLESGDSINLTSKFMQIRPLEAAYKLNQAFNLGLVITGAEKARKKKAAPIHSDGKDLYRKWHKKALFIVSDYIRICIKLLNAVTVTPLQNDRGRSERDRAELLQDNMMSMNAYDAYYYYRMEVNEIESRLQRGQKFLERNTI